jgi:hypothetical protein
VKTTRLLAPTAAALLCLAALASPAGAAPAETAPVWRAFLQILVCDVSNAGTDGLDNAVKAYLNTANVTVLNSPRDDFERGRVYQFDLLLTNVSQISDVVYLKISKVGSDGLCVKSITLHLNNRAAYQRTYADGQWLDGSQRTLLVPSGTLRTHAYWQAWNGPASPPALPAAEIVSRVSSGIATGMYKGSGGSHLRWDSNVMPALGTPNTGALSVPVSAYLEYKCIDPNFGDGFCADWTLLYSFDLRFQCVGGQIVVSVVDIGALRLDSRGLLTQSSGYVGDVLYDDIPPKVADAFRSIRFPGCPGMSFGADGSVTFF